jgi:hypothetical protein
MEWVMPEKVSIKCEGLIVSVGDVIKVAVKGAAVKLPRQLVYEHDPEYRVVVIPRWLAEEKDIEANSI